MTFKELQKLSLTIAIPTFKRNDLLELALRSAIFQVGNFCYEIIVLDDDPNGTISKNIEEILNFNHKNIEIRYIRNKENLGIYRNWNKCIMECKTDYITILNDDDLLHKNFLKEITQYLSKFDLVAVDADTIGGKKIEYNFAVSFTRDVWHSVLSVLNRIRFLQVVKMRDFLKGHPYVASLGVVFSREKAIEAGQFNPEFYPSSDYEFFFRFWKTGRCVKLRKSLASYRWEVNVSLNVETLRGWLIKDREIKCILITECLPARLHRVAHFLVNYQSNVSAYRYKLQVPDFMPYEVLIDLGIPHFRFARTRLGQNLSSLLWQFLLPDFVVPGTIRRKLQLVDIVR